MVREIVRTLGICIFTSILQAHALDNNDKTPPYSQGPKGDGAQPTDIEISSELDNIFGELSWASRLQLLDKYYPTPNMTVLPIDSPLGRRKLDDSSHGKLQRQLPSQQSVLPGVQEPPPGQLRSRRADREVGISALEITGKPVAGRQGSSGDPNANRENDEINMKKKLFRMMYETVRDSDLKIMRAEAIQAQYSNSSLFKLGYMMGNLNDKYSMMSDIALTLKRMYNAWRPIEHVNAYEQIANQAIEISHLVDLARTLHNNPPLRSPVKRMSIDKKDNKT